MESEVREEINERIKQIKTSLQNLDSFKIGNFVDILDENKNWCVGQIMEKVGEILLVHYEGCPTKMDEKVSVNKTFKITHFRRNTKNYTGLKKSAVRDYQFDPEHLKEVENYIKLFTNDKFKFCQNPEEITQNLRGKIFFFIDIFMTTQYTLKEQNLVVPLICNLIFDYLNMSVEFFKFYQENLFIVNEYLIKTKDLFLVDPKCAVLASLPEVICTLKRILGEDSRVSEFYKIHEENIKKHFKSINLITKNKICIEKAYKSSSQYNNLPALIIATLLDYFYDIKGFESIFNIILNDSKSSQTLTFEILDVLLNFLVLFKIVIDMKNHFTNETLKLKNYFYNRINNLTELEIKEIKKMNLINTIRNLTFILPGVDSKTQKSIFEDMYLNYHYKCLTSKNLEKRIQGITSFNLIIDTVDRKENFSQLSSKIDLDENIETLDSKSLVNFFKDKNFIEIILGENIHEEIIKRSLPLFRLMAKKNNLNNTIYDQLWKNYLEKHESISIQIETIICELSYYILEKDKQYLFNKIKSITNSNNLNKTKIIIFIKNFTESCLKNTLMNFNSIKSVDFFNDERLFGLPLLWNYMQDLTHQENLNNSTNMITDLQINKNCQISLEIIELSQNSIIELMQINQVDENVKEKIISLCLENISNNTSVVQSSNLMKKMIMDFSNMNSKRIVKKMDETFNLLNLILTDFKKYMNKVKEILNNNNEMITIMNVLFDGFFNHKTQIDSRLDTIYFFANGSKDRGRINLNQQNMDQLWNLFVTNSNCESEMNIFVDSLRRNCDDFDDDLVEYIFTKLISQMDFTKMNINLSNLFEKFLNSTNYNKMKFSYDSRNYRVGNEEIIGLDVIFEILKNVESDLVRQNMSKLLVSLCLDLKTFNEDFANKYWNIFMEKVFKTLNESYADKNEKGIKGIVNFIRNMINSIGHPGEIPISDEINFGRDGLEYTFIYPEKNENRNIKVSSNELVYDVRVKIAYFFDIPINNLKLQSKSKILDMSDDFKIFRELVTYNTSVEVKEDQHPILNLKNNPKNIIMNESKQLRILYELLHNSQMSVIQDVWELVNILPKNQELEEELINLGKSGNENIDWEKYFDHQSIYIMSYSLKIVKQIISSNDPQFNIDWINNFSEKKGVNFLFGLLNEFKLDHFREDLAFECLNDLIYLLKQMLSVKMEESINPKLTINIIMQLICTIINSSLIKDQDYHLIDLQDRFIKMKRNKNEESQDDFNIQSSEDICEEILKIWNYEDETIKNLANFILQIFKDDSLIMKVLMEEKEILKCLVNSALTCPKNYKFKNSIHQFIQGLLLSVTNEVDKTTFKSVLFENMLNSETFKIAIDNKQTSGNFFKILANLMESHLEINSNENNKSDYIKLAEEMINYIQRYDINDKNSYDSILEGYLIVLRVLILKSREILEVLMKKQDLIKLILNECLFSKCHQHSTKAAMPKCSSAESMESAYRLLTAISYNNPDIIKRIIQVLKESHSLGYWKSNRLLDWRISLQADEKSSSGFVGLKNLGCTCYMNSLLQQFYMMPQLRESILACPDNHSGPHQESALFQLKNIFAGLKAYDSQFYNPKELTRNFDGQKLDIREQMDVDEFFNTLIDKVENHLKDTEYQNLFKHFFGFTVSDEFICKGCPHFSERNVYSQSIQLQVLNKKSIIESLNSYVEGELLEGDNAYFCEKCDRKVNALKRQCIKHLPRVLIVVMKRFEFDYETFVKIKVNDYCEFPHELNMEPYTQEFLNKKENVDIQKNTDEMMTDENVNIKPENYYKYNLSGVIIHTGTSESGHYYSLIKDYSKENWYEFNDTNVRDYDLTDLPNEAFGGTETIYNRENKKEIVDKQTNAYLLFYTRQYECDDASSVIEKDSNNFNSTVIRSFDKFSNISPTIMDTIDTDNLQYWITKILFSNEYHSFITDLIVNSNTYDNLVKNYLTKNDNFDLIQRNLININVKKEMIISNAINNDYVVLLNKQDELNLFKFACSFFFNILIRARDKNYLPQMVDIMKAFINKDSTYAHWLLEEFSNEDLIYEYLCECPNYEMRKIVCGVLYAAMIKIYKNNSNQNKEIENNSILIQFINTILNFTLKQKNGDTDLSYVYLILYRFSILGELSQKYLIDVGLLHYLTNNYLNKNGKENQELVKKLKIESPVNNLHNELNTKLMTKVERLSAIEELLEKKQLDKMMASRFNDYILMTFCELVKSSNYSEDILLNKYLCFTNPNLLKVLLLEAKSKTSAICFSKMINNLCKNNSEITNVFMEVLLECINNMDTFELEFVMRIFKRFIIKIEDDLKETRIKKALSKYFLILIDNIRFWSFIDFNVDFINKLFFNNFDLLNNQIDSIKDYLLKIIKFLKDNPYPPSLVPSKVCSMYKKKNIMFSNKVTQMQMNSFIQRFTNLTNEKIDKLKLIWTKKCDSQIDNDSDCDLTDFKFSLKDKIKFENLNATVINVLDEMIHIEYDKEELTNFKRPPTQWVETDNKTLVIVELYENSEMKVE